MHLSALSLFKKKKNYKKENLIWALAYKGIAIILFFFSLIINFYDVIKNAA